LVLSNLSEQKKVVKDIKKVEQALAKTLSRLSYLSILNSTFFIIVVLRYSIREYLI
ncbi:uncharacterized protein C8A04DRAFT_13153, partial [Dichotomopilus funicola]